MAVALAHATQANSLSVTIPATAAGNCLVVVVSSYNGSAQSVSGMTLGGSAGNFGSLKTAGGTGPFLAIWADPDCAGGQTAVAISGSNLQVDAGNGNVAVYEFSGLAATLAGLLDKSSSNTGTGLSWSSGTTATTAQADEAWAGGEAGQEAVTGPGSPWTNNPSTYGIAGRQVRTTTGTATYSGTMAMSGAWAAAVVCLLPFGGVQANAGPAGGAGSAAQPGMAAAASAGTAAGAAAAPAGAGGAGTGWLYAGAASGVSGSWVDTANAVGSGTGTYATWTGAGSGEAATLELSSFGAQAAVPAGAAVDQVRCKVRHGEDPAAEIASVTAQAYLGTSPLGSPQALTVAAAVHEDEITLPAMTRDDLADLRVRLTATRVT